MIFGLIQPKSIDIFWEFCEGDGFTGDEQQMWYLAVLDCLCIRRNRENIKRMWNYIYDKRAAFEIIERLYDPVDICWNI